MKNKIKGGVTGSSSKPNIILITLHDLGTHLPIYDPELPATPNISRFASDALVFENHFSTAPLCSPSRSSIQTGCYPHVNGMNGLVHRGFKLKPDSKCISHFLSENGYHTALYGHQHETHESPALLGYKEICPEKNEHEGCMEKINNAINFLSHRPPSPFFLSIGLREVHRPFRDFNPASIEQKYIKVPSYLVNCPEIRSDLADFYGVIGSFDKAFGQLLESIEKLKLLQDTVIIFTTDHGAAFPRAKSTLYDSGVRVSFIAHWPKTIVPGRTKALTSHVDILPTILDLVNIQKPAYFNGRSMIELFTNPDRALNEFIFAEKSWHGDEYDPMRCIRSNQWKYIINFVSGYLYQSPLDIKLSPSGKVMECFRKKERPFTELYDIESDPCEFKNLSGQMEFTEIENSLRLVLLKYMKETNDPLPDNPILWPKMGVMHYLNNRAYTCQ